MSKKILWVAFPALLMRTASHGLRSPRRSVATLLALMVVLGLPVAQAVAQPDAPVGVADVDIDGQVFAVGPLTLRFYEDHPDHPGLGELGELDVTFGVTPTGLVAPREGMSTTTHSIATLGDGEVRQMYASAITEVMRRIVRDFRERSIIGVFVAPDTNQLILDASRGWPDTRGGDPALTLVIYTARVTSVRTIASGTRVDEDNRIDNRRHRRISRNSPVTAEPGNDLLVKAPLDRYALRLNRHPNRRVDIAVAPASDGIGAAELQYLVQENKPWTIYAQISNTGTESTDELRERFGFQHTQFTGADDTFLFEYVTAGFDASHLLVVNYERPLNDWIKIRGDANWNEFEASEVGLLNEVFTGEGWGAGGELAFTVYQNDELFVDLIGGARFQHIEVTNPGLNVGVVGEADLFLPRAGIRLERYTDTSSVNISTILEWSHNREATGVTRAELQRLGRINPADEWLVLRWNAEASVFLEPIFNGRNWRDTTSPRSSTLAHELVGAFRGQYGFNNRLIPQQESVIGGLYSVRGYDESVAVGDTSILLSAEYRFHIPRALPVNPDPQARLFGRTFKWAPQQVYGRPDWDLIFRAFVDAGWTWNHSALPFELNETLYGAGIGFELLVLRNLSARVDWAVALDELQNGAQDEGDNRIHFVVTVLF